jgi:hypothetical protein
MSLMRRENEFLKLLADCGGIANPTTKDFVDTHIALMENMAASGEPTSGLPHIRVDKRTSHATLDSLEAKGKIKVLKTSIPAVMGAPRHVRVAYLPSVEQARVDEFMAELPHSNLAYLTTAKSAKKTPSAAPGAAQEFAELHGSSGLPPQTSRPETHREEPPAPGQPIHIERPILPVELLDVDKGNYNANVKRADELFQLDDQTLRGLFLTDRNTLSQLYGFLPGKALRSKQVHLAALDAFEKETVSTSVVSKEHRIISTAFYFSDAPLATYCSVVSMLEPNEDLSNLLSTEEGRSMPVMQLSQEIYHALQVGKARSRNRLLDLFDVLQELRLLTPLRPCSAADNPSIQCAPNGEHPTAFEVWSEEWSTTNQQSAPAYWRFNITAPIYLWVVSETDPPFWKDMTVVSRSDGKAYWDDLERMSIKRAEAKSVDCPEIGSATGSHINSARLARSIRRNASWRSEYEMTWHQRHYLRRYVNVTTGNTPLEDAEHGQETLARLVRITSVPTAATTEFFTKARAKQLREISRVKKRHKEAVRAKEEEKTLTAQRAALALAEKEQNWTDMVARVRRGPLQGTHADRVARVKTRFMHGGSASSDKWEAEIRRAIQEADMVTEAALGQTSRPLAPGVEPPTFALAGKSVRQLVAAQGPAKNIVPKAKRPRKVKGKAGKEDPKPEAAGTYILLRLLRKIPTGFAIDEKVKSALASQKRRSRFLWTRELDELAQDAMVIVRTRCADARRVELSALEQVFTVPPRNAVRMRVATMREQPNVDAYMKRLEEHWGQLWRQYRGTDDLPDADPTSTTNFDLIEHIEFLRRHIDKTAL